LTLAIPGLIHAQCKWGFRTATIFDAVKNSDAARTVDVSGGLLDGLFETPLLEEEHFKNPINSL